MKLLIDAGNTRLKWMVRDLDSPIESGDCSNRQWVALAQVLKRYPVTQVAVASVASREVNSGIKDVVANGFGIAPVFAKVRKHFDGLTVAYNDISQLGVDRWLAMLAAWARERSACVVVDAGSAITVDYIDDAGQHLGGLIVPGGNMMRSSLFDATAAVKVEPLSLGNDWRPGLDTMDCVANGLIAMLKGFCREVGSLDFSGGYLTGGDGKLLESLLGNNMQFRQHLVLEGLNHVNLPEDSVAPEAQ